MKESVADTSSLVLVMEGNLIVLQNSLNNLKKTLADMREINKQGLIEDTDVDQIELTSLNIENALSTVKRQVDASYNLLKFQMGVPLEEKMITITDTPCSLRRRMNDSTICVCLTPSAAVGSSSTTTFRSQITARAMATA